MNTNNNQLLLIHWNCNPIKNKIDELNEFCKLYKPHIISLNETKLSEENAKYYLELPNYNIVHRARSKTVNGAGGVALLVRKDVKFCNDNMFDSLHLETCAINIFIENKEILIMSYFKPPNVQLSSTLFNEIIKQKSR